MAIEWFMLVSLDFKVGVGWGVMFQPSDVPLPQIDMELEMGPFKEDSSLQRSLFQAPCLCGRVYSVWEHKSAVFKIMDP